MSNARVKKLIHRANYRGFKEADLILGGFAKDFAFALTEEELDQFEALLDEKDHDIYDWICERSVIPPRHNTKLFARIAAYQPDGTNL